MTLIDHKLFCALGSEYDKNKFLLFSFEIFDLFYRELLLQGWMKPGREDLAPNVALVSKRFNEVKKKN
jgi:hypothetical protein